MSRYALCFASVVFLTTSLVSAETVTGDSGIPITKEAHSALHELQTRAVAAAMDSASVEETSPILQGSFLNQMRTDINYMQRQLAVLQEEQASLGATRQAAVKETAALVQDADKNVHLALEYLSANGDHVDDRKYHAYLKSIENDCKEAAQILQPTVDNLPPVTASHKLKRALTLGFGS